jgi:hypothetical protein
MISPKDLNKIIEQLAELKSVHALSFLKGILSNKKDDFASEQFDAEKFLRGLWEEGIKLSSNDLNATGKQIMNQNNITTYNLIPSDGTGACHAFCLALASGSFGEKYYPTYGKIGFKGMALKLIRHWFECLNANEETLILTKDWNKTQFDDLYKPVIETYCDTYRKRVFILVVDDSSMRMIYDK